MIRSDLTSPFNSVHGVSPRESKAQFKADTQRARGRAVVAKLVISTEPPEEPNEVLNGKCWGLIFK